MAFTKDGHWVWDFWIADDGDLFHLYYLHAPTSLVDPDLRHRNARIGHATSADLVAWSDHGEVLAPGPAGSFDATATWTGSVVRGDDGLWRMFYTGSVFPDPVAFTNVESIGVATSEDLYTWHKRDGFVIRAAPMTYEKLGDSDWPEEAWRDPWVFRDADGDGWHMLITARALGSGLRDGGVIGHATSPDLDEWTVRPPLSAASERFPHLEVLQLAEIDGAPVLVFCGPDRSVAGAPVEGVWIVPAPGFPASGPIPVDDATLLAPAPLYAGRIVRDRQGRDVLMAFIGSPASGQLGGITDPMPLPAL